MRGKLLLESTILAVTCLMSVTAGAEPIALRNVSALVRDADLIAVGRIESVSYRGDEVLGISGPPVPVHQMVAELKISRILKGQTSNSHVWFAFFISDVRSFKGIAVSEFAMFFLRRGTFQGYAVLNPYYPFVVALPGGSVGGSNAQDKVTGELAHVLTSPSASQDERVDAIDALDTIDTPSSTSTLQKGTQTQNLTVKLLASAALLRRNEISTLNAITNRLLEQPRSVSEAILWKLSFAIENGIKDTRAIQALSRLLGAGDVRVRRAAASGLRRTGASDAIPGLAKALNDNDQAVRYSAVIALAEITGQYEWGPSIDLFQRDERRYLVHWREFSKTR